jgi:hypothetical protein
MLPQYSSIDISISTGEYFFFQARTVAGAGSSVGEDNPELTDKAGAEKEIDDSH